jgi:hypothetical protein
MRRAADLLTRASTLALPRGPVRDRYREEHHAELCVLGPAQQYPYAVGALTSAWALRRAVSKEAVMTTISVKRKPLMCRLNVHHTWKWHRNPEGGRYRRCSRCGKDHPSIGNGPLDYLSGG